MASDERHRLGTPRGLRLPGILPEPAAIEPEGEELSDGERAVLADLDEALPAEDRSADWQETPPPAQAERPRARLPWWLGTAFFGAAGIASVGAALLGGPVWRAVLFVAAGVAWLWMAGQAWHHRRRDE